MGMFDTVFFDCKNCGAQFSKQSKAGACELKKYHQSNVPADIAKDLSTDYTFEKDYNTVKCPNCAEVYSVVAPRMPRVPIKLVKHSLRQYD